MSDTTELIKEKIDLVEFIRKKTPLTPAGRNFKGLCPFHKEKSPSMIVSPEKQIWHCFGCGKGGDVIRFLMDYEHLDFFEALRALADQAGIPMQKISGPDQRALDILYEINAAAKDFFVQSRIPTVMNYLKDDRGLTQATIDEFEIGYAPDGTDMLFRYLLKKGFRENDIDRAGLLVHGKYNKQYLDRFRNRILFPLYNSFGKIIGFTGRQMPGVEDGMGKYVNTPETPIFHKSKLLFGFHKTKDFIREKEMVLVVEGQMDFLMAWQAGIKYVVATSGTALTADHLKLLKRFCDQLIFAFDQDDAGQRAVDRAATLALPLDFTIKVMKITEPSYKDPADVVRKQPGLLEKYLAASIDLPEYYFEYFLGNGTLRPEVLKKQVREILLRLKLMSPIDKQHWLKRLSERVRIDEKILWEELDHLTEDITMQQRTGEEVVAPPIYSFSRKELAFQQLVCAVLATPTLKSFAQDHREHFPERYQRIIDNICNGLPLKAEDEALYNFLLLRSSAGELPSDIPSYLNNLILRIKIENLKEERDRLGEMIARLEKSDSSIELQTVMSQFDKVAKEIQNLKHE